MFQQARNNLGQKEPGTNYNIKISIYATVKQAKAIEYSKTSGKPGQSLLLKDDDGEEEWVKLTGKFDVLNNSHIGQRYEFLVWPFQPEQSPKVYLYCWIQRQVPQDSQQAPQQARQSTNAPNTTILSAERQCAWKSACSVAASNLDMTLEEVEQWAVRGLSFIQFGKPIDRGGQPNPDYVGDDPPPPDDDNIGF